MACQLQPCSIFACSRPSLSSGDQRNGPPTELLPVFRRRLLVGVGSASLVGIGANFAGVTTFLLGFSPDIARRLRLDVIYPIQGYSRYLDTSQGFEFIYPANWVGDQTLLYRAAEKLESDRSLDLPPLITNKRAPRKYFNEPVVAFGPPASNGELNVSVIVSPVPVDFSLDAFGEAEIRETVLKSVATGVSQRSDVNATLIDSKVRRETSGFSKVNYYVLEFRVDGPSFHRHNIAVCTAWRGWLYTLNAQSPDDGWPDVREKFYNMSDSFTLITNA